MADRAPCPACADHGGATLRIEHAGLTRGAEEAATIGGIAGKPAVPLDADGVDHTLEFRSGADRVT